VLPRGLPSADLRDASTTPLNFTKSINLALSERGINALRHSGSPDLLRGIMDQTIPMYGRMIHGQDSTGALIEASQLYDVHGRSINAVDRGDLNGRLLDELETLPNVKLRFGHKITGVDFHRRLAWLEQKGTSRRPSEHTRFSGRPGRPEEIEIDFDLIIGCDGAHSSVRFHLMKFVRLDFKQSYIDTLWCEFEIPPADEGSSHTPSAKDGFRTSPNHLHIWPGQDKMFIAIPSVDKTFTSTLFAPAGDFEELEQDPNKVELFFNKHFPGAADLIGPESLRQQFLENPHLPLVSVKCSPHYFESSGVIVGDAAHAMVPFYGQGMNSGLEDVRVLFSYLDAHPITPEGRAEALKSYNAERIADAHAINDLSLENYYDMRAGVTSKLVQFRKAVEEFLSDKMPSTGFATQYSRVSFSNQRYSEVIRAVELQKRILLQGMIASALVPVLSYAVWATWRVHHGRGTRDILGSISQRIGRILSKWW
jgi:kynurenine 3-monooxygenase